MEDHEPLLAQMKSKHSEVDWNDYLTGTKKAATYDGKLVGIPYRITPASSTTSGHCWNRPDSASRRARGTNS